MIPRNQPTYSLADIRATLELLRSGENIGDMLRSVLADHYKVKHVFLFSKAREALSALLMAHNDPGNVLIPAYTCIAVPEAIRLAGYHPAFVDIDLRTLNFSMKELAGSVDGKSKAILIAHQFGVPAEIDSMLDLCKKHGLLAIEDAAPAFGAKYQGQLVGRFGDAAILSFDKTKVLSGAGGGALLTNNDDLAARVQRNAAMLLQPGSNLVGFMDSLAYFLSTQPRLYAGSLLLYRMMKQETLYEIARVGNTRIAGYPRALSVFQAGIILVQMNRLEQILNRRREVAGQYLEALRTDPGFVLPTIPNSSSPTWSQFPILVKNKEMLFWKMRKLGVDLSWNYKYSCPESYGLGDFLNSLEAAKSVLGLPVHPSLAESELEEIIAKISR